MRGHYFSMRCFELALKGQVEESFTHDESSFKEFHGHTVACDANTSIEMTAFRQSSDRIFALFNVYPGSKRRQVHYWDARASLGAHGLVCMVCARGRRSKIYALGKVGSANKAFTIYQ